MKTPGSLKSCLLMKNHILIYLLPKHGDVHPGSVMVNGFGTRIEVPPEAETGDVVPSEAGTAVSSKAEAGAVVLFEPEKKTVVPSKSVTGMAAPTASAKGMGEGHIQTVS